MLRTALATTTLLLTLTACGGEEENAPDQALTTETARNGDVYSSADVAFATAMIPLHAEALALVDLTLERDLSPELRALADEIQLTDNPEVQEMTSWLTSWDEPIPETVRDHVNAGHGDDHAHGNEEFADLAAQDGEAFEDRFVELMIEVQQESIEVAADQQESGSFQPAVDLAGSIEAAHQERLELLEGLQD